MVFNPGLEPGDIITNDKLIFLDAPQGGERKVKILQF